MGIVLSVLAVIGTVLKWVLFVILGLLGLVLLILILICSCSICYRAGGKNEGKELSAKAKVTYLFSLLRVYVDYSEKKLSYKVKVLWFNIASSEKEKAEKEEAFHEHGELEVEKIDASKPNPEAEPHADEASTEPIKSEIAESESDENDSVINDNGETDSVETDGVETDGVGLDNAEVVESAIETVLPAATEPVKEPSRISVFEKRSRLQQGLDIMKMDPDELLDMWKSKQEEQERQAAERQAVKAEKKLQQEKEKAQKAAEKEARKKLAEEAKAKKASEKKTKEPKPKATLTERIDRGIDTIWAAWDLFWDVFDAILDAPDKIDEILDEKVGPKLEKFRKYKRIYDKYPRKKETLDVLLRLVRDVLKPLVPKRYEAEIAFGTGDPAITATMLGFYYAYAPRILPKQNRRQHLEVSADMEERKLETEGELRGHFSINTVLVFPLLKALFNRDTIRLIRFILKLRKQLKKKGDN